MLGHVRPGAFGGRFMLIKLDKKTVSLGLSVTL